MPHLAKSSRRLSSIRPNSHLQQLSQTLWEATGNDPCFLVPGPFRQGNYTLRVRGFVDSALPSTPIKIYHALDSGTFCSEKDCFIFTALPKKGESEEREMHFALPLDVCSLRFDPLECRGRFRLSKFDLKRDSDSVVTKYWHTGLYLLCAFLKHPRSFMRGLINLINNGLAGIQSNTRAPVDQLVDVSDSLPEAEAINFRVSNHGSLSEPFLNVLLPFIHTSFMTGGHNNAFNLTLRLAREGIPVRYIATLMEADRDADALWAHFRSLTGIDERFPNVEVVSGHNRNKATVIGENDVFFGTAWYTAQMIKQVMPRMRSKKFIYLIQDYEPGFYPWSTKYALALETYELDFRAIVCESLLLDYLLEQRVGRFSESSFRDKCLVFEPAMDRSKFYPELHETRSRKKRLLIYKRPIKVPRNLDELSILALKKAVGAGAFPADEWDLVSIGWERQSLYLGNGAVVHPAGWLSYDAYAALLRHSDVGLSLMLSPHTSYPPLEMAACGLIVVTNTFACKTAGRLKSISDNIIPVKPTLDSVVEGLLEASIRNTNLEARVAGSVTSLSQSWDAVFEPLLPKVIEMIQDCMQSKAR